MEFRAHIASLNMLAGYPKEGRARKVLFHYLRVNGVRIMHSMIPRLTKPVYAVLLVSGLPPIVGAARDLCSSARF